MSLSREQFNRLTATFWPLMGPEKVNRAYDSYAAGTRSLPPESYESAVEWALNESEKMPIPAELTRRARAAARSTAVVQYGEGQLVRCIGRGTKPCDTLFPIWTDCPTCYPGGSRTPRPMVTHAQYSFEQEEEMRANGWTPTYTAPNATSR